MGEALSYIRDAKNKTGISIIGYVRVIDEAKTGTKKKDGTPFTLQNVTVADYSGEITLALWDSDVGKLELNRYYKFSNMWVTMYEGKLRLNLGKFATIADAKQEDMLPIPAEQSTLDTTVDGTSTATAVSPMTMPVDPIKVMEQCKVMVNDFIECCQQSEIKPSPESCASVWCTVLIAKKGQY